MHTNDASSTVNRLLDMGVEDYLLTSTVIGILAQRLVRNSAPAARSRPGAARSRRAAWLAKIAGTRDVTLFHAKGCAQCGHTGYLGRFCILEMLPMTDPLRTSS